MIRNLSTIEEYLKDRIVNGISFYQKELIKMHLGQMSISHVSWSNILFTSRIPSLLSSSYFTLSTTTIIIIIIIVNYYFIICIDIE